MFFWYNIFKSLNKTTRGEKNEFKTPKKEF